MLEMGCGEGRLTVGIAADAEHVLAFDPAAEAIAEARVPSQPNSRSASSIVPPPRRRLEIEPHSFDLVVFSWSL